MAHGQRDLSVSKKFVLYLEVMGKDWFEVGPDMQIYILERLFCKQYRGKIPEADRAGKQIIVILK